MQALPYVPWFHCCSSVSWYLWPSLQRNCAWHGSRLFHSLLQDQAARVCNLCCLQIFSGSGSLVSSALLSPGLPSCQGACCVNSYITSFPAAGKFLTLGLFELGHTLFVCTREKKTKPKRKQWLCVVDFVYRGILKAQLLLILMAFCHNKSSFSFTLLLILFLLISLPEGLTDFFSISNFMHWKDRYKTVSITYEGQTLRNFVLADLPSEHNGFAASY